MKEEEAVERIKEENRRRGKRHRKRKERGRCNGEEGKVGAGGGVKGQRRPSEKPCKQ